MEIDWESFNRQMGNFAPLFKMMIQRKLEEERVRRWLEKSKEEYKAWGEQQRITQERGAAISRRDQLIQFGRVYFKDKPHAMSQFLNYVNNLFPDQPMGAEFVPENLQEILAGARGATTDAIMAEQAAEPITQDVVADLVSSYGYEMPTEGIRSVLAEKKAAADRALRERTLDVGETRGAAERALTARGLDIEEALVPVRKGELAVRVREAEDKGKPKKSALENKLDSKRKERWTTIEKFYKPEESTTTELKEVYEARIESLNKEIHALKGKTGTDPDERYDRLAKKLKAQGFKRKDLFENEELKLWMNQNNFVVWILLEYF